MKSIQESKDCDPILYRLYFSLMLPDILIFLDSPATKEAKLLLHDFHKRILGYETISGRSHEVVSRFIADVVVLWAERGLFVRTSGRQPNGIQDMDLADCWDLL